MLDLLFYIFIYPIEWFMQFVLNGLFVISDNYGISIILLSIVVNILILPLYYLAQHLKHQNQLQLASLTPTIDLIKRNCSAQERQYYLQALYKNNNYHPFSNVKASLGLLLQIPFFFAAFDFLGNYPAFNAVSFGIIPDLGQSDQLLFGQNLLPILMVIVNLISAYLYSKTMSQSDKYQFLGLSVIFLVLLYQENSALLIYWTMTNVISLIRNWVENRFNLDLFKRFCVNLMTYPMKKIRTNRLWVIHPFLLAVFPILSLLSYNINQDYYPSALLAISVSLGVTTLMLIVLKLAIKDIKKTAIIASVSIILFYSYGHIYRALFDMFIFQQRYLFLIFALLFLSVAYLTLRVKKDLTNLTKKINIFSFVLVMIPTINIAILLQTNNNQEDNKISTAQNIAVDKTNAPTRDIYYIILDGYAHSQTLKDVYSYDNQAFEDSLTKKGFFIATKSVSNYAQTSLSLASSLNMQYINNNINGAYTGVLRPIKKNNALLNFAKSKGYTYININSGHSDTGTKHNEFADINFSDGGVFDDFIINLYNSTILVVFNDFIKNEHAKIILYAFSKLKEIYKIKKPTFTLAHIISPHAPYVFDAQGNVITTISYENNDWRNKEAYIEQLKFISKKTIETVKDIIKNSKVEPIIVIQADHGSASTFGPAGSYLEILDHTETSSIRSMKERMRILNAYYLPDGGNKILYNSITPVNSFRKIFNFYFKTNYDLLPDISYFSDYNQPHKFTDVTKDVKF